MSAVLENEGDTGLAFVTMGLGWDPVGGRWLGGGKPDIDLNAAAVLFAGESLVDVVYHEQLMSEDGSVRLLGDSTTGAGEGDDEVITVDLTRLTPTVTAVIFIVTSYSGQPFEQIGNAFCRLVDGMNGIEFARYELDGGHGATGFVMGTLTRSPRGLWQYRPIAETMQAKHPVEAVPQLAPYLV
ncbi:TerD family protein [Nocardia sp. NPDC050710]|uniref:TerD family protein n=1 Tax=Nocardia sp. NPDC050710 TaxID=3157220 RepID=UPI003403A153